MDLYATILDLAQADLPPDHVLDGRSLTSYLRGDTGSPRSVHYYFRGAEVFAVRSGEWKLHLMKMRQGPKGRYTTPTLCEPLELYNLDQDPGETRNLQADHPEVVARVADLGAEFEQSITPGPAPPPRWRSVLPRVRFGKKKPQR
jgi:arylsulfatase A-like enzyme